MKTYFYSYAIHVISFSVTQLQCTGRLLLGLSIDSTRLRTSFPMLMPELVRRQIATPMIVILIVSFFLVNIFSMRRIITIFVVRMNA